MKKQELICARLRVSYDRGTKRNNATDLGLEEAPTVTSDGGLVRGLGSHWRSEEAKAKAKELATVEGRLRREFSQAFPPSPIEGIYVLPAKGAGRALVESLDVPAEISAHVTEFTFGLFDALPPAELEEWAERVARQLQSVPLGRKKEADAGGLAALERLAECPIFAEETRQEILSLIADARLEAIDRVELKRFLLNDLEVKVAVGDVAPRRVRMDPVRDDTPQDNARRRSVSVTLDGDGVGVTPAEIVNGSATSRS